MGSMRDRMVWRHHSSRNFPAQAGLQKVGVDGLEIVAKEITQRKCWSAPRLLTATEQPAGFPEDRGAALTSHAAGVLGTDVVQCLVHIGDDVKSGRGYAALRSSFHGSSIR